MSRCAVTRCIDGTPAGYYHAKAKSDAQATQWVIYLQVADSTLTHSPTQHNHSTQRTHSTQHTHTRTKLLTSCAQGGGFCNSTAPCSSNPNDISCSCRLNTTIGSSTGAYTRSPSSPTHAALRQRGSGLLDSLCMYMLLLCMLLCVYASVSSVCAVVCVCFCVCVCACMLLCLYLPPCVLSAV